jgi:hypothetical protein
MNRNIPITVDINVLGLDLTATAYYHPGDPGRLSGPPEKCYPPEPAEVEVVKLFCGKYDMCVLLESDVADEICDKCIEVIEESYSED